MSKPGRLVVLGAIAALALATPGLLFNAPARIGAGYVAKITCSEVFVAGRAPERVAADDFAGISPFLTYVGVQVDAADKKVRASIYGLGASTATYREGLGCTLLATGASDLAPVTPPPAVDPAPMPTARPISGEAIARIDYGAIHTVLSQAMEDGAAGHRAFAILVDGRLVDERYGQGFSAKTRFQSWSMAKSVAASLVGAGVQRGVIDVNDPAPIWNGADDPRGRITWNDLLRMQSGLDFVEDYADPMSDVNKMLFRAPAMGEVAAEMPVAYQPGEHWAYSSGTSNILSWALEKQLRAAGRDLQGFAAEAIFAPLGASSFVLETDTAGNFVGSSYVYATAHDWLRLGQLYLQDGSWGADQILPADWSDYVAAPTAPSDGQYGAHFWLNFDGADGRARFLPGLPEDVYYMAGHDGQYVIIIPSKRAVIFRAGITRGETPPIEVVAPVIAALYDAIGAPRVDDIAPTEHN